MNESNSLPLTSAAKLQRIRMLNGTFGTSFLGQGNPPPVRGRISQSVRYGVAESLLEVQAEFSLELVPVATPADQVSSEDSDSEPSPVAWISSAFGLDYTLPEDLHTSDKDLREFSDGTAVYHAWPYLREFVQNCFARMDLPGVTLPLLQRRPPEIVAKSESTRVSPKSKSHHR